MTISFTEEEFDNINKTPFNWSIKEDAPEKIRKSLKKKLSLLLKEEEITTLSDERPYRI